MAKRKGGVEGDGALPVELEPFRPRVRHDGWTPPRRKLFLKALRETGCIRQACARVGISSTSAYRYRRLDPSFARAWQLALARMQPQLEHAAFERAVEGWEEPIVQGGKVVGTRRRYSDSLLRLLIQRGARNDEDAPVMRTPDELEEIARQAAEAANGTFSPRDELGQTGRERLEAKLLLMHERLVEDAWECWVAATREELADLRRLLGQDTAAMDGAWALAETFWLHERAPRTYPRPDNWRDHLPPLPLACAAAGGTARPGPEAAVAEGAW